MNAEIGTEATQFPEKEYINEIVVAVCPTIGLRKTIGLSIIGLRSPLLNYHLSEPGKKHLCSALQIVINSEVMTTNKKTNSRWCLNFVT